MDLSQLTLIRFRWLHAAAMMVALLPVSCERPPSTGGTTGIPAAPTAGAPAPGSSVAALKPAGAPLPATQATASRQSTEVPLRYVAYYFHRTLRCTTCLSIEKQAREAIEGEFDPQLQTGVLEWRAINIETAGNEHFETEFQLESQSLVLVELLGEHVNRWKLLPKTWDLVEEPPAFAKYFIAEVAAFLGR